MIPSITIPENEELIMKEQGLCEHGISWKPGHLYLTDKRVIFAQGARIFFQGALKNLAFCKVVKRKCILGKMVKQLMFVFGNKKIHIATRNTEEWMNIIGQTVNHTHLKVRAHTNLGSNSSQS
jgi:hypothetical protein